MNPGPEIVNNIVNSLQSEMIDKEYYYTKYSPSRLAQSFYLTPVYEEEIKQEIKTRIRRNHQDATQLEPTVNNDMLSNKLAYYGIRGHVNEFFKSYLSNRRQYAVVNGLRSQINNITCGVPQGSAPGLVLFLLYVYDLYRSVG